MQTGRVKFFNSEKGFGFIERGNKDDIFVHCSEVKNESDGYLKEGQEVEFEIGEGKKGPCATEVRVLS